MSAVTLPPSAHSVPAVTHESRPTAVLIGVSTNLRALLKPVLSGYGYEPIERDTLDEETVHAPVVVVEADRAGRMLDTVRAVRALNDHAFAVGVVGWWSVLEPDLARIADAVLHTPLREDNLRTVLLAIPECATAGATAMHATV